MWAPMPGLAPQGGNRRGRRSPISERARLRIDWKKLIENNFDTAPWSAALPYGRSTDPSTHGFPRDLPAVRSQVTGPTRRTYSGSSFGNRIYLPRTVNIKECLDATLI